MHLMFGHIAIWVLIAYEGVEILHQFPPGVALGHQEIAHTLGILHEVVCQRACARKSV